MKLRDTAIKLAIETFSLLERCLKNNYQVGEETITDINMLSFKDTHKLEIITKLFNKNEESKNGADWEWWFTDYECKKWIGVRVQAKVLKLETKKFEQLKHSNKNGFQIDTLEKQAKKDGLYPLYCLYIYNNELPSYFGCSISNIDNIRNNLSNKNLSDIKKEIYPWHILFDDLVCSIPPYTSNKSLPEVVFNILTHINYNRESVIEYKEFENIPNYISKMLTNDFIIEGFEKDIKGVVIFKEKKVSDEE